jgi:transcriptional regulator with XRE-family HTH domain
VLRDVGRRIAELRIGLGLTQAQLAERVGVDVNHVSWLESGRQNLSLRSIARIAKHLRVDASELLALPHSRARPPRGRPKKTIA